MRLPKRLNPTTDLSTRMVVEVRIAQPLEILGPEKECHGLGT